MREKRMQSGWSAWGLTVGLALVLCAGTAWGNANGAPPGSSGAPGEGNCSCHTPAGFLTPGGVEILGPARYAPGETYAVTVRLVEPPGGTDRWGLQLTAIDSLTEQGAGSFVALDPAVLDAFVWITGRPYLNQKACGLSGQPACPQVSGVPTWQADWVAPASDVGNVDLYVAANAADGGGTSADDNSYPRLGSPNNFAATLQILPEPTAGLGFLSALAVLAALRRRA